LFTSLSTGGLPLIHVLLVEDNQELREEINECLRAEGWEVTQVSSMAAFHDLLKNAVFSVDSTPWHLALIDIYLPDGAGFEAIQELSSKNSNIGILAFSGKVTQEERLMCFEHGADDVIAKPVYLRELTSRMRALLRRTSMRQDFAESQQWAQSIRSYDHIIFSLSDGTLQLKGREGQPAHLTRLEAELFNVLLLAKGETLSRRALLEKVWNQTEGVETRTVDVYVSRIRKILNDLGGEQTANYVQSVRGEGYRLLTPGPGLTSGEPV
jgi:DNA-binding response OmpR family regulator